MRHRLAASAVALGAMFLLPGANAHAEGVKVGTLTCHVDGGWGYILGSSRDLACEYDPDHGTPDRYLGSLSKFGVDIGYTSGATLVWAVVAPSFRSGPGALQGDYAGATASATVIEGVGANVLVGGLDRSIALQPVSIEGSAGYFDVAAGVGELHLRAAEPMPLPAPARVSAATPPPAPPEHFAIFFDFNRSALSPEAKSVVRAAVDAAEQTGRVRVRVTGHTDTVGSESYNQGLSVRRAEAVRAEMVHDGLNPQQIAIVGRGFHDPLVPTGPGVREPQNRRAVIDLGNAVVGENSRSLTRSRAAL